MFLGIQTRLFFSIAHVGSVFANFIHRTLTAEAENFELPKTDGSNLTPDAWC
jgi:hypothetical protein